MSESTAPLPLSGLRVIEFVHMVMGPSCGLVLADMGAEVIKVEPVEGDKTRNLRGSGAGFFPTYNRNKKSLAVDLKSAEGRQLVLDLVKTADAVAENFRPGGMDALGLGYEDMKAVNPQLVYCSLKGFLPGPYEHRKALDEVVQMMGGLAYMTGPPGRPLRAGASVNDVMGGLFAAFAILGAIHERGRTGKGQFVQSALFENNAYLVAQHMAEGAATGIPARPMPDRNPAWAIYTIFETADDSQLFVGIVTDTQWTAFCEHFGRHDLLADPDLATNVQRAERRDELDAIVRGLFRTMSEAELVALCEEIGLPFAPITKPEDLFEDPHLRASGGFVNVALRDGRRMDLPGLPIEMDGRRFDARLDPPQVGEHTMEVLRDLGYDADRIRQLTEAGTIGGAGASDLSDVAE